MKTLLLMVKKEWFAKIQDGTKLIDYRDCTDFWVSRLIDDVLDPETENETIIFTQFDQVKFLCGKDTIVKNYVKTELDEEEGLFLIYIS